MTTLEIIIIIVGALAGLVTIGATFNKIVGKIGTISEKVAAGGNTVATMLDTFGMEKASMIVKEGADIPDELGDLATMFAELTADKKLTAAEVKLLFEAGKELFVELKDFRIKVFPKKVE